MTDLTDEERYFHDGGWFLAIDLIRKHQRLDLAYADALASCQMQHLPPITKRLFRTAADLMEMRPIAIAMVEAAQ